MYNIRMFYRIIITRIMRMAIREDRDSALSRSGDRTMKFVLFAII